MKGRAGQWEGLFGAYDIPDKFADVVLGNTDGWTKARLHAELSTFYLWVRNAELYHSNRRMKSQKKPGSATPAHVRARRTPVQIPTPFGDHTAP
jgi:hypothetical protein